MANYKLETSIQFPFFKLNELVSYTEVKKPSGVAFMILVLLNESKDKSQRISTVLSNFGVPTNLHYLFASAIENLIRQDFLEMTDDDMDYHSSDFENYDIADIKFTQKGTKIFAEKAIPTGTTKEAKIPVYYNIALKKFLLSIDNSLEPKPLMDSPISPEFMSAHSVDKDVETFLNLNKGNKISIYENGKVVKTELIKKEEVITDISEQSKENWIAKYDCTINLNGNKCTFEFEDKALQNFFDANYSNEMINGFIGFKSKFKFKSAYSENLRLEDYLKKDILGIIIPKDIDNYLKQKGQLFLTKGNYLSTSYQNTVNDVKCLNVYDSTCEFITVDQANNRVAYFPGNFVFDSEKFGSITIPLVAKVRVTENELQKTLDPYLETLSEYTEENFRNLVKITKISKDYENAYKVFSDYLTNDYEKNIVLLNEMKASALMDANILSKYKEKLKENYDSYLEKITEENLVTTLKITSSIPKFLNIQNKDVLSKIFNSLGNVDSTVFVYETLVSNGFDKQLVVLYVNPIRDALSNADVYDKSLVDLRNFDSNVNSLKTLSGINDYRSYSFDMENVDRVAFKKCYTTAKSLMSQISFFKVENEDLFNDYDGFMKVFGSINDEFNMLDAALSNPKNIKKELINRKIDSGDFQYAFVNLSAKLELILKDKFKLSGKLSEMLSEARRNNLFDRDIATDLHDFREVRNSFAHVDGKAHKFTPDDLRRWCDEIFVLEEDKKDEPPSNN